MTLISKTKVVIKKYFLTFYFNITFYVKAFKYLHTLCVKLSDSLFLCQSPIVN